MMLRCLIVLLGAAAVGSCAVFGTAYTVELASSGESTYSVTITLADGQYQSITLPARHVLSRDLIAQHFDVEAHTDDGVLTMTIYRNHRAVHHEVSSTIEIRDCCPYTEVLQ